MQYFGVPRCPYCKKRVNIIRTWSLKKQGEYKCPRCNGISNIFQSPLIWVAALLAIFCGIALYFFHKFIAADMGLKAAVEILIPFAAFFVISLFMIYLKQPVIKKAQKRKLGVRPQKIESASDVNKRKGMEGRRVNFRDDAENIMNRSETPKQGPALQKKKNGKLPSVAPKASKTDSVPFQLNINEKELNRDRVIEARNEARNNEPKEKPDRLQRESAEVIQSANISENIEERIKLNRTAEIPVRKINQNAEPVEREIRPVEISDDFFAKYDDREYVNRRLKEIEAEENKEKKSE